MFSLLNLSGFLRGPRGSQIDMAKAKHKQIFNNQSRKVYRKRISLREVGFSAFFVFFVALMTLWFFAQEDNFNPGERDIDIALLVENSVEDELYRTPFEQWVDRTAAVVSSAGAAAAPQVGIFPAAILDGGWKTTARVREYDESNLYEKAPMNRRQFIRRVTTVGGITGALGFVSLAPENWPGSIRDKDKPGIRSMSQHNPDTFRDFSVAKPFGASDVGISRATGTPKEKLRRALDGIGLMGNKAQGLTPEDGKFAEFQSKNFTLPQARLKAI